MFQINLVERCKANDRKAQLKLYKQYCDAMYYVAFGFLKNSDDAEDVVQESFIKAFQKIEQYSGEVSFGAWLKKIVVNRSLDFIKNKKEIRVEMNESHLSIVENDDWSVPEATTVQEVKLKMDKLPEKYKYVVRLFLVEGYDHSEIAEILNLSESACRTRLLRGKGYLRALLKN
ncbi:RNA polymerase sigma factor [Aurantibacter sp.]|uniref:RNA polymerase sigma factor n=1 Tax=Aurantibacter sp. TaxID=2807103 RepID=UPI003262CD7A